MYIVIGILAGIILVLLTAIILLRRQVKNICRQLAFLKKNKSNMMITSELQWGGIRELTEELNSLLEEQNKSRQSYQAHEKEIADTYTNLSHDIRTPLTSLDGYVQLLGESRDEEEQRRYIAVIEERISSLKDMLEELFTFARLKNSSYEMELSPCSLNRILKETLFSYYEEWRNQGIEPVLEITEEPLVISGNTQALKRTVQNIIKNGIDHGEKEIRIALFRQGNYAVLRFKNKVLHSQDIDPEKIFDRFYKADQARSRRSTGLGLSIAQGFTEHMNGTIKASLEENWFSIEIRFSVEK